MIRDIFLAVFVGAIPFLIMASGVFFGRLDVIFIGMVSMLIAVVVYLLLPALPGDTTMGDTSGYA